METVKTNAEAIREMNDEALASWIKEVLNKGFEWFDYRYCSKCLKEHNGKWPPKEELCSTCTEAVIAWLREPAEI